MVLLCVKPRLLPNFSVSESLLLANVTCSQISCHCADSLFKISVSV